MTTVRWQNLEFRFEDADVCNPDDAIYAGDCNPHNVRLWLLHDVGFTLAVVWASSLQDALDAAVDEGKLDRFQVTEDDAADYGGDIYNSESLDYLGNANEPFDIESLGYVAFNPPELSLTKLCGETIEATKGHTT